MTEDAKLIERLRAWHTPGETITGDVALYLEAADRLSALSAENERLRAILAEQRQGWIEDDNHDRGAVAD